MRKYDAVVIGGGHNGLVNAAYLAKSGLKVALLEKRSSKLVIRLVSQFPMGP